MKQLDEGKIHGYMALDGDTPIGWCNADNIECYAKNDFKFVPVFARENARGKTMAVVCFTVAPEYRGKGVALALLEHVLTDARAKGYAFVEGYAKILENGPLYDFTGPIHLYKRAGFIEAARVDDTAVMRRAL